MARKSKQKSDPKDEGSLEGVMEFIPRHGEDNQVGPWVQGRNSATITLCHGCAELSEEFAQNLRRNVWPIFDSSLIQWDTDS